MCVCVCVPAYKVTDFTSLGVVEVGRGFIIYGLCCPLPACLVMSVVGQMYHVSLQANQDACDQLFSGPFICQLQ